MSRPLILGVLIILLALVGVMANIVQKPYHKDEPKQQQALTPAQQKEKAEQAQKQADAQRKMMALEMKKNQALASKTAPAKRSPGASPKGTGQMDLSEDWWKRRTDGQAGVESLKAKDAEEKQQQEAANKERMKAAAAASLEQKTK